MGEELAAKLKAGMDDGENEEEGTGLKGQLGSEHGDGTMYGWRKRGDQGGDGSTGKGKAGIANMERGRDGRSGWVSLWNGRETAGAV